jgi:hypothetical protein
MKIVVDHSQCFFTNKRQRLASNEMLAKEKEYLLPIPSMNVLTCYLSREEEKCMWLIKDP